MRQSTPSSANPMEGNLPVQPIDTDAFLRDLYELRRIGAFRTGVHRPTFSLQDMESRRWLMQ